jgi:uncharacterized protein DUF3800
MTTIFFDEAGNTGGDLTNAEQPVFVLASHQIPEDDCHALLRAHFPRSQAPELKHSNVRKHGGSQRGMVELLKTIRAAAMPVALYPVHKRFSLYQRLFDYFAEPVLYEHGIDIAKDAMNIQITNAGYVLLENKFGKAWMGRAMALFQAAVRKSSTAELAELWRHLERARKARPGVTRFYLNMLLVGKVDGTHHLESLPADPLNAALSCVVALVAHWRRLSEGPFVIIHDESKPLADNKAVWDWLSSPEQQEAVLGFGDYRDMPLPLNVTETRLAKSHEYAGLQLADLLAGACLETCRLALGDTSNEGYARALVEAGAGDVVNNIWPEAGWEPPEGSASGDPLDPLNFLARSPLFSQA